MNKKLNVQKIQILGQEYLVRVSPNHNMDEITKYVNMKMDEVIKSGVDKNSQQLRIAVFACLEIAGELLLYKKNKTDIATNLENKSKIIVQSIEEKLNKISEDK